VSRSLARRPPTDLPITGRTSGPPRLAEVAEQHGALTLSAVFLCVAVIGVWHHEMWGDEWQAWLIAVDSRSIPELMRNLRVEGHLPGWHLLLFLLSRLTRDPAAMQALHLALATGSIYLLARFAPLPWVLKVLAAFSYFLAYEYAIVARHYALAVLALFVFCALFPRRRRHPIAITLALIVLASTSVYGVILAGAAVGMLLLDEATASTSGDHRLRGMARIGLLVWVGLSLAAAAFAVAHQVDALAGVPGASSSVRFSRWSIAATVSRMTTVYLPVPELPTPYWGSHILAGGGRVELGVRLALALGVGLAAVLLFLRTPPVLLFFLVGTGGILLFSHLVFAGFLRHHGLLFVLFLACLWLARVQARVWHAPGSLARWSGTDAPWAAAFVGAVLMIQVTTAGIVYTADIRRPFAVGADVAEFIRDEQLDHLPIAAAPSHRAIPIAGSLDRPIYYLAVGASATFVPWDRYVRHRDDNVSMVHMRAFLDGLESGALIVLEAVFWDWDEGLEVEELARFGPGLIRNDTFVVYRVGRGEP
jgi:hypothetical protein